MPGYGRRPALVGKNTLMLLSGSLGLVTQQAFGESLPKALEWSGVWACAVDFPCPAKGPCQRWARDVALSHDTLSGGKWVMMSPRPPEPLPQSA